MRFVYRFRKLYWTITVWIGSIIPALALAQEIKVPDNPAGSNNQNPSNPLDTFQFHLSEIIIGFGFVVILIQMFTLRRIVTLTADEIARNYAITIVVTAALVLVIAGYSSAQIAPAFGLFGTIVGYLLGRTNRRPDTNSEAGPGGPPPGGPGGASREGPRPEPGEAARPERGEAARPEPAGG